MRDRRRLFVLLAVAALAVSAVGSGGFSTTTADRSVTVDVVDNETNAYMALAYYDEERKSIDEGQEVTFLTVKNHFSENGVTIDVSPSTSDLTPTWSGLEGSVGSGVELESKVSFTCENQSSDEEVDVAVSFDVTANGESVYAETTDKRVVPYSVQCVPDTTPTATSTNTNTEDSTETATETTEGTPTNTVTHTSTETATETATETPTG